MVSKSLRYYHLITFRKPILKTINKIAKTAIKFIKEPKNTKCIKTLWSRNVAKNANMIMVKSPDNRSKPGISSSDTILLIITKVITNDIIGRK